MSALLEYAQVSCTFTIAKTYIVREINGGLCGLFLDEAAVSPTWEKDYDTFESPSSWATTWNLAKWGMISVFAEGERVGGCIVAYDTEGVEMLEGRSDLTALWDIRVAPAHRRLGIASSLFKHAVAWSRQRNCLAMKIETQNNNVAACRFYQAQGCILKTINRFAYSELPDETQLIWYKFIC